MGGNWEGKRASQSQVLHYTIIDRLLTHPPTVSGEAKKATFYKSSFKMHQLGHKVFYAIVSIE